MNNRDLVLSDTINFMRYPLALAIMYIHAPGLIPINLDLIHENTFSLYSFYDMLRICFSNVIAHISVPTFLLISGYLFFNNLKEWNWNIYFTKLRKKFFTLFIPYILWNIIIVLAKCLVIYFKGESVSLYINDILSQGVLRIFWDCVPELNAPANVPLWFIRDLMIIMVLSPIIYAFVKYTKIYGIILLLVLYIFNFWPSITGFSVIVYAFFSLGAYFSVNKISLLDICKEYKVVWYLTTFALLFPLIWYNSYNNPIFGYKLLNLFRITGIFALFHFSFYIVRNMKVKTWPILYESSFFLYATHMIYILFVVDIVINKIVPSTATIVLIIKYLLCPIICSFVCIGIYWMLKKYLPTLLNILTGRVKV